MKRWVWWDREQLSWMWMEGEKVCEELVCASDEARKRKENMSF